MAEEETPKNLSKDDLDTVQGGITLDNGIKRQRGITLDNGLKQTGVWAPDNDPAIADNAGVDGALKTDT